MAIAGSRRSSHQQITRNQSTIPLWFLPSNFLAPTLSPGTIHIALHTRLCQLDAQAACGVANRVRVGPGAVGVNAASVHLKPDAHAPVAHVLAAVPVPKGVFGRTLMGCSAN
jgi:hypothetical protein